MYSKITQAKTRESGRLWLVKLALLLSLSILAACSDGGDDSDKEKDRDDDDEKVEVIHRYEVKVVNVTANQPLSPLAVVWHEDDMRLWQVGMAASTALEKLAEGGANDDLLASLDDDDASGISGQGVIAPGGSESLMLSIAEDEPHYLSLLGMLVNTNDAFAGISAVDISSLQKGGSMMLNAAVYDAGTERNSEAAGSIPGPADGGEGYNAARDDHADQVSRHPGVVSVDDGLGSSVLDESHRFDSPALMVTISRLE